MRCLRTAVQSYLLVLLQQTLDARECSAEEGYFGASHNVPGHHGPTVKGDSDACAIHCGQVEGCAFWTFDLGSNNCWLKTSDADKGENHPGVNFLRGKPCGRLDFGDTMDSSRDIKPGHQMVKEFHFHPYWAQHNKEQEAEALALRDKIILEVLAGNMTVVCNGINSEILPGLDDTKVPHFNTEPIGPHPVGSFEIWTPIEFLPNMMTFMMYNRGSLSVLVHPLGRTEIRDHTSDAMWLGPSFPLDTSVLSPDGGDDPQYPQLGLGYSRRD